MTDLLSQGVREKNMLEMDCSDICDLYQMSKVGGLQQWVVPVGRASSYPGIV